MTNTFVCVLKSGGDFSLDYVRVLYRRLKDQCKAPWELVCLTDLVYEELVYQGVRFVPLQENWPGRWSKIELFRPEMRRFLPFLFVDLDTFILRNPDGMMQSLRNINKWTMLKDLYRPERPASGLMYFPEGEPDYGVWNEFVSNGEYILAKDGGRADDGEFIYRHTYPQMFFQDAFPNAITSFKPLNEKREPVWLSSLPEKEVFVCFHGNPRPRIAAQKVPWVSLYWNIGETTAYSNYTHRYEGTLAIVGSAPSWKKDFDWVKKNRPEYRVMTIGHAAGFVQADFVVTDHYEVHSILTKLQLQFHDQFTQHCTRCSFWQRFTKWVDYWWDWERSDCSSVHTAIRIGLAMGFTEIILCGSPLEHAKIQHKEQIKKDGADWPPPNTEGGRGSDDQLGWYQENFQKHVPEWKGKVFSLSGFTREQLGGPKA